MGLLKAIEACGRVSEVLVACSCLLDRKRMAMPTTKCHCLLSGQE